MNKLSPLVKRYWPIVVLAIIELALFVTNYRQGTYLVGWDNLFPEFDFGLNFKRVFFAVWQEYRGLGLEDGMSHAANLPHYLYLWFLSFIFPQNMLRYIFMSSMHLLGGLGMYKLAKQLFTKKTGGFPNRSSQLVSLFAALFYEFNFATIQMFYLPFEVFIVHFAFLPWLIWSLLNFFLHKTRKTLFLFAIFSFLSTPQAHVPTVFIVYTGILLLFLLFQLLRSRGKDLRPVIAILLVTFTVNAYWGLPFAWSTKNNTQTIAASKNNQMATEDIFLKNHEYGDFKNTALMRSFALEIVQYDFRKEASDYMLLPWRDHIKSPMIEGLAWVFFSMALIGGLLTIVRKDLHLLPFSALFLVAFAAIGNDIPLIEYISHFFRTSVPLLGNIFRFVYTKFFVLYAFSFTILITYALISLINILGKLKLRLLPTVLGLFSVGAILFTSYPVFQGHFFYDNLRVTIPQEYFDLFAFFKKQPQDERIAILPAPWYWAWTQYRWGSIGSGFQWFSIGQPTLDRAFDPWSDKNENFYWEISQSLYASDKDRFERVLRKYDVSWLIVDGQIINPEKPAGALNIQQMENNINLSDKIEFVRNFNRIKVYKIDSLSASNQFIALTNSVKNVGPEYNYNDYDQAMRDHESYITTESQPFAEYYPFRSLFTGREQEDLEFEVEEREKEIVFRSRIPNEFSGYSLIVPQFNNDSLIDVDPNKRWEERVKYYPEVRLGVKTILALNESSASQSATVVLPQFANGDIIDIAIPKVYGYYSYNSDPWNDFEQAKRSCDTFNTGLIEHELFSKEAKKTLRLTSLNSSNCVNFPFSYFPQRQSYLALIESKNSEGKPLKLDLINTQTGRTIIDTLLEKKLEFKTAYIVIPPLEYYSLGYNFNLDNISIGRQKTVNELRKLSIYQIPYDFLASLKLVIPESDQSVSNFSEPSTSNYELTSDSHPNPAEYWVTLRQSSRQAIQAPTLILSQSFHPGWLAYEVSSSQSAVRGFLHKTFPYLFGKRLTNHVLVNNWANGWILDQPKLDARRSVYILFWPQLLEFLGFALLPLPFLWIFKRKRKLN